MKLKNKVKLENPLIQREHIPFTLSDRRIVEIMAENNLDATKILLKLYKSGDDWLPIISNLEDMNIRGIQIVLAYTYADDEINKFKNLIFNRDKDMIDTINIVSAVKYLPFIAMQSGATSKLQSTNIFDKMELMFSEKTRNAILEQFEKYNKSVKTQEL